MENAASYPRTVVDELGAVHRLAETPIGRGGQGVVFRTHSPDVAVKLLTTGASMRAPTGDARTRLHTTLGGTGMTLDADVDVERLRARLDDVRLLPLDELHIARPIAPLRGHAGYAMQMLAEMEPMGALIASPSADLAGFFVGTGGLRRRLTALARTASLLARLHAIPVVYGDVSPNNVFVSTDHEAAQAWLIDADNLHIEGTGGPTVYTPGFGAPEVVQGRSRATTLADAWAFAVLAFYVLCQTHPFLGDLVAADDWEHSVDQEQQAYAGQLPWIHDVDDDRNYGETGIFPRDLVLSRRLHELAERTFGASRRHISARPGIAEWADVLQRAADLTVLCTACGSTFYISARQCPWCDEAPPARFLYMRVHRWNPDVDKDHTPAGSPVAHLVIDGDREVVEIDRRLLTPTLARDREQPWLRLERTRRGYQITPLVDRKFTLIETETGRISDLTGPLHLDRPVAGREWHLHCGPHDAYHRVASFRFFPGAR